jgi:hypothetical protein
LLRQVAAGVAAQARDLSSAAQHVARIVANAVDHLPVRTPNALLADHGGDTETAATKVIDDAANVARWLWTAAAAVPGPPGIVHTIKVIAHSAIEIRVLGELYAIHGDPRLIGRSSETRNTAPRPASQGRLDQSHVGCLRRGQRRCAGDAHLPLLEW